MANKACTSRLLKEYKLLQQEPVPGIQAHPNPTNLLEWHYTIDGPSDSPYEGGLYHGKLTFPSQYPYKPPSLMMVTPSGRFHPNTKLCLSMTDFHPESWNPMWSVGTILNGLLSFMTDTAQTTGSMSSTHEEKRRLAAASLEYNTKNVMFRKLFPERCEELKRRQQQQEQQQRDDRAAAGAAPHTAAATAPQPSAREPMNARSCLTTMAILGVALAVIAVPLLSSA